SDGPSMDVEDNVYLTDPEHGAILALGPDRSLRTLVKDPRLRWPDGLSFGPDGWLYVTCSALQHVLFVRTAHMRAHAPYQIFRFKPGPAGVPGQSAFSASRRPSLTPPAPRGAAPAPRPPS